MVSVRGLRIEILKVLEHFLPLGSVQCSPHTLLVDLTFNIEESWRASARPMQETNDNSPTNMLGIPHQLVLVEVRLEHHLLQCAIHVLHESHARGVSI